MKAPPAYIHENIWLEYYVSICMSVVNIKKNPIIMYRFYRRKKVTCILSCNIEGEYFFYLTTACP